MKPGNQHGHRNEPTPVQGQKVAETRRHLRSMRNTKAARGKRTRRPVQARRRNR
jgi:hypothetical protein